MDETNGKSETCEIKEEEARAIISARVTSEICS